MTLHSDTPRSTNEKLRIEQFLREALRSFPDLDHLAYVGLGEAQCSVEDEGMGLNDSHRGLEVEECTGMQGQETHLTGRWCRVDEDEGKALPSIGMVELIREQDVTRSVLGEFWRNLVGQYTSVGGWTELNEGKILPDG